MFNLEQLTPLTVNQIVAYDELQKNNVFDGPRSQSAHAKKQYGIKRDCFSKVNIEHGTLAAKRTKLHCNYVEESRF